MTSLRFVAEAAGALVASFALFALGWGVAAEGMLGFASSAFHSVLLEDAGVVPRVRLHVGLVCALPPLVALAADVVHRLRQRTAPSVARLLSWLAAVAVAVALGFLLHLLRARGVATAAGSSTVEPLVALASLSPAPTGLRFGVAAGVVLLLVTAARRR